MFRAKLRKHFNFKETVLLGTALGLFIFAGNLHRNFDMPTPELTKQDTALNVNQQILLFFNFGNKRLIADLLWIQTLLESDEEHYSQPDLNSWMHLRFKSISLLDPLFYENYMYGGLYLSVVKDDTHGASDILERGLSVYPDDYTLNYYAGFNSYFEQEDYEKGFKYLSKIQNYPQAPSFLKLIVNKLQHELVNDSKLTLDFLKHQFQTTKDEYLKSKLKSDIYSLQTQIDLECLNQHLNNCSKLDLEGNPYILKNKRWISQKEFLPYRLHRHEK